MPEVIWSFRARAVVLLWPLLVWWLAVLVVPLVLLVALRRWLLCSVPSSWWQVAGSGDRVGAGNGICGWPTSRGLWKPRCMPNLPGAGAQRRPACHGRQRGVLWRTAGRCQAQRERGYFFSPEPGLLFSVDLDILDVLSLWNTITA